jgi:hypothetical protein
MEFRLYIAIDRKYKEVDPHSKNDFKAWTRHWYIKYKDDMVNGGITSDFSDWYDNEKKYEDYRNNCEI